MITLAELPVTEARAALRPDLRLVADFIPDGARVLDLGCGDGELLEFLVRYKGVKGRGIELSEAGVLACVRRGLSGRHGAAGRGAWQDGGTKAGQSPHDHRDHRRR
ncbi:MAG: methionine biosynthesis protein MetW, partial [Anaerolineae bacterium]|nr:methionine biosynthesis protein MetW [Anaerolineae bacterium]